MASPYASFFHMHRNIYNSKAHFSEVYKKNKKYCVKLFCLYGNFTGYGKTIKKAKISAIRIARRAHDRLVSEEHVFQSSQSARQIQHDDPMFRLSQCVEMRLVKSSSESPAKVH